MESFLQNQNIKYKWNILPIGSIFISHGISHHRNVYTNVNSIIEYLSCKTNLDRNSKHLLLIASMIHDIARPQEVNYDSHFIYQNLSDLKFDNESENYLNYLILAHNNVKLIKDIYGAILFLADKLEFNFNRGFLVQMYDKIKQQLHEKNQKNKKINLLEINSELMQKSKSDIEAIKQIEKKYPVLEHFTSLVIKNYESVSSETNSIMDKYGDNLNNYKLLLIKLLKKEMIQEIKSRNQLGYSTNDFVLLLNHIEIICKFDTNGLKFRILRMIARKNLLFILIKFL